LTGFLALLHDSRQNEGKASARTPLNDLAFESRALGYAGSH
jgi:hypothetical protein